MRGHAAIFALWKQWLQTFDDVTVEVYEYIDAHPWVVCPSRWHGTGRQSGAAIDLRVADAIKVEEGKIVCVVLGYPDTDAALKAADLSQ